MFGFLKNYKPEIQKQIDKAILEEKRRLESIKEDINIKLSQNEEVDESEYSIRLMFPSFSDIIYRKENFIVEKASSREMFQALNKICPDAEYNVDKDTATGTVKRHSIFMMRHKGLRGHYVSISATVLDIQKYVKQYIEEYKRQEESEKVPEFIKNVTGS